MASKLLVIDKNSFIGSPLYVDVMNYIFTNNRYRFGDKVGEDSIKYKFGDKKSALNDFLSFEPEIERLYFDLEKKQIRSLIVSFYNINDKLEFALIAYAPTRKKYEFVFFTGNINNIDTEENDLRLLEPQLNKRIIYLAKDRGLDSLSIKSSLSYSSYDGIYHVGATKFSNELKELLEVILIDKMDSSSIDVIKLKTINTDVLNIEDPLLMSVQFQYEEKKYEYWFDTDELVEIDDFDYSDSVPSYLDALFELASKSFIEANYYIIEEREHKRRKESTIEFFSSFYKKFTLKEFDNNSYGFEELGEPAFIFLDDDCVKLRTSRNIDIEDIVTFNYLDLSDNKVEIRRVIDRYILTKTKEYDAFIKEADDFLNNSYDLETMKEKAITLLNKVQSLPSYDRSLTPFTALMEKIKNKSDKFTNLDKSKISHVLDLISKIKDPAPYDKYNDDLFDAIDELSEGEFAAIKNDYDSFLEKFGDIPLYLANQTIRRRVFIRKSALEQLKRINLEQRDLKVLSIVDEIVDKLKTIPGNELGRYLLNKGLNFPIKADRSIKKIRIMRNSKYRLLFVYGSDIESNDRLSNLDSIYIFAVTEHKKDKAELYRVAESKPTKYEINDFIIYPKNKIVKIPECTSEQYKIAALYEDKPVITFGCAGSGKTTVSIEQYVNIVYSKYNCVSPSTSDLVYITFHKGLSDKVKKDLAEFKIDANCFKLDEYFAYVIGETYNPDKIINEVVFINWFEKTYSELEIKKNKGKKKNKISPLLSKPDIARLLYTYYRGVFKGSKELFHINDNYLSLESFLDEMSGETYLTDEEKNAIYQISKEFDEYATKNGLISDNDYAVKVIRQASYQIKRTNCIIIDEVQDLTEIEVIATILTLKEDSTRIYFYGDPHQSIYPNVFNASTINIVYSTLDKTTSNESAPLIVTYRTNKHLIRYLNQLLQYRDKWIGLTKGGLSEIIEPPKLDEETSWAGYVTNKSLYKKIFISNPNSMIITPSESVRRKLLEKYPEIEPARAITIYDAKGMEWDTIIMYNMFTDYESYFLDMISENGKAKKSTIHRMTFNKYYVGCTRSTKSFVIIEENEKLFDADNPIFKALLSSFAPISKSEQIDTYILEENTFEAWYREALQNLDNDNSQTFEHALMHARRLAKTSEDMKLLNELIDGKPENLEMRGLNYLREKEYDLARSAFVKCNKTTKKHGPYILLASILGGKKISDDHLREFLKHQDIINKYPEVLPKLVNLPVFKARLKRIQNRLFNEEDKKNA